MSACAQSFTLTVQNLARLRVRGYADGLIRMYSPFKSDEPPWDGTMPISYAPGTYPDGSLNSKTVWDTTTGAFSLPTITNPFHDGGCVLDGERANLVRAIVYWDAVFGRWFFGFNGPFGGYNWRQQTIDSGDPRGSYEPSFFDCASPNIVIEDY